MEDKPKMKIVIPSKIKKTNNYNQDCYHYDLIEIKKHIVIYKCKETGMLESFSKNEFIKEV